MSVEHVPVNMLATKHKEKLQNTIQGEVHNNLSGFCRDRYFERMPGFIDVQVLLVDS